MKFTKVSLTLTCIMMLVIAGCGGNDRADNKETPTTQPLETLAPTTTPDATAEPTAQPTPTPVPKPPVLTKSEAIAFVKQSNPWDMEFYIDKSYTLKEMYDYFAAYFTPNYVDNIIMMNMKKDGDRYVLAYPESELAEASFFDPNISDKATVEQNNDRVTITHLIENDGLYAPHKEIISLIHTESGWKIDDVKWEYIIQTQ
ncbi:MAG TPA: hypothetical protein VGE40_01080 [Bacilli bacterium]